MKPNQAREGLHVATRAGFEGVIKELISGNQALVTIDGRNFIEHLSDLRILPDEEPNPHVVD